MNHEVELLAFARAFAQGLVNFFERVPRREADVRKRLYYELNGIANNLKKKHKLSLERICASMAVLSPQSEPTVWVERTRRALDTYVNESNCPWDDRMEAAALGPLAHLWQVDAQLGASLNDLGAIRGKRLCELASPRHKALWILVFDKAFGAKDAPALPFATDKSAPFCWGSVGSLATSIALFTSNDLSQVSFLLGDSPRVRNLYNNIVDPYNRKSFVTVDRHFVSAAFGRPLTSVTREVAQVFGAQGVGRSANGSVGTYGLYVTAAELGARIVGYKVPSEFQCVCSYAARSLFTPEFSGPVGAVVSAATLSAVDLGLLGLAEARSINIQRAEKYGHTGQVPSLEWSEQPNALTHVVSREQWEQLLQASENSLRDRDPVDSNEEPAISAFDLEDSPCFTGLERELNRLSIDRLTRTQFLRAEYGDDVPEPWTAELDLRLPRELTDQALRIDPSLKRRQMSVEEYR